MGEDVAEEEGGALARRQSLRRGHKRETNGLADSGHHSRIGALVKDQAVRDRLQPGDIAGRWAGRRPVDRTMAVPAPMAARRRWRPFSQVRHLLVAIRYSQVRTDERPSKLSNARQART